jgi:hypothetical protein
LSQRERKKGEERVGEGGRIDVNYLAKHIFRKMTFKFAKKVPDITRHASPPNKRCFLGFTIRVASREYLLMLKQS